MRSQRSWAEPWKHATSPQLVCELSPSELRILRYLPTNLTRSDIARELYVSVNTVNTHVHNIYSKLGVGSRTEAVERARRLCAFSPARSNSDQVTRS